MFLNACHVFGPDVDGFVENGERFEFGHGFQRRAQVGFVALRVGGRDGHLDVQAGVLRGAQRRQSLRRRGRFRLINFGQVVAQGRQTHTEDEALAEAFEQIKVGPRQRTAGENADVERGLVSDEFERTAHEEARARPVRVGAPARDDG